MLRSQKAVEIKELMSLLIMKTSNTEYNVNIIPTLLAAGLKTTISDLYESEYK